MTGNRPHPFLFMLAAGTCAADDLLRVYAPDECVPEGYPAAWASAPDGQLAIKHHVRALADHRCVRCGHPYVVGRSGVWEPASFEGASLARELGIQCRAVDLGFELADDRLIKPVIESIDISKARRTHWSPCDQRCMHAGEVRGQLHPAISDRWRPLKFSERWPNAGVWRAFMPVQASWRILTVHHFNGVKADCRWWNLGALCQRCHLEIQGKVMMERVYPLEHSEWFKPYAAGWYASAYLHEELTREQTMGRLEELLWLERMA